MMAHQSDRKLTILQLITPRRYSGAERVVTYLSEALADRGHRVVVGCKHNDLLLDELRARDIEVRVLPIRGKLNLAAPFHVAKFAHQIGADIIHTHLSSASLWGSLGARKAGIPSVGHVHCLNHKQWYVYANHILAVGDAVRRHIASQGVPDSRISVIYNGLDSRRFDWPVDTAGAREQLGLSEGQPAIGVIAHLSPHKGHLYLVDAMQELSRLFPDLRCFFIGAGANERILRRTIDEYGLKDNVQLLGYRHDAIELCKGLDIVVLPSLAEGLPIALIEAGFLGKPAVGSNIAGTNEVIVHEQTGLLVPPGDVTALTAAIARLIAAPDEATKFGAAARKRMEALFTLDAMAQNVEQLYFQILDKSI